MQHDVSPQILEGLKKAFAEAVTNDAKIQSFNKKISDRTARYIDAHNYSTNLGTLLGDVLKKNIRLEELPNGKLYWHIAKDTVEPMIRNNYSLVMTASDKVADIENEVSGIKLGSVKPEINEDKIHGILNSITDEEIEQATLEQRLYDETVNITESFFDDFIKSNAEFQYQCGMSPKVVRKVQRGCCEWCKSLEGTYEYRDVANTGNDVWRRHLSCHCSITVYHENGVVNTVPSARTNRAKTKIRR